jgi:hypothetical protein
MACRKAFDLDLVACLLDTGRPEWSEFRDHYPRCADCAAEVRTWTELQSGLAPPHPTPEDLLRFDARGNDLAVDARTAIAAHIATCRSCRDELRALRAFDPRTLAPEIAAGPAARRPRWWHGIGRLLVHPAFAYGIALALAVPALAPRLRLLVERNLVARRTTSTRAVEAPAPEPNAIAHTERADVRHEAPAGAPREHEDAGPAAARDGWPVVVLTPDREVSLHQPQRGLVLRLAPPRSQPALPPGLAWLRVRDTAGRRELREQQFDMPGSDAEIRVPAGWLEPGGYRADLVLGDDHRPVAVARFRVEP